MSNSSVVIYDTSRDKVAYLQNAVKIGYEWRLNEVGRAWFSLPADDPKVSECTARRYAEIYDGDDRVGLFRLTQPIDTARDSGGKFLRFEAEHVLATLIDDILFQYHEQGGTGVYTTDILDYILGEQVTGNWTKGTCAFSKQFTYNWENENLLAALFSVPKPFVESYQWTWDTTSYPWTLNLIAAPTSVVSYIDYGRNLKGIKKTEDPGRLITRIYPLGFGEGINQLGIKGISAFTSGSVEFTEGETVTGASSGETGVVTSYNLEGGAWGDGDGAGALFLANLSGEFTDGENLNGSVGGNNMATYGIRATAHIDSDNQGTYGVISAPFVDRGYESEETLYHAAWTVLQENKTPRMTYAVDAAHIYQLTENSIDDFSIGGLVKVDDSDLGVTVETRVKVVTKPDLTGAPGDIGIALANKVTDIEGFQANLAYRQHINDVYAQGATNLDSHDYEDNCDGSYPAKIRFYIPSETVHINKVLLSYKTEKFRAYATGAASGGGTTPTTSSGGATTSSSGGGQTTSSGGGSTPTTSNGGGSTPTTSSGGGQTTSSGGGSTPTTASGGGQTSGGASPQTGFVMDLTSYPTLSAEGPGSHSHDNQNYDHQHYSGATHYHSVAAHTHTVTIAKHTHTVSDHTHDVTIPNHTHTVTIPNHTHTVSNHTHTIGNHTHTVTISNHTHSMVYGIYLKSPAPTGVTVTVDGNAVGGLGLNETNVNIVPYLSTDSGGKISKGTWHEVQITPNDLGRIVANVIEQFFVQSRGTGVY